MQVYKPASGADVITMRDYANGVLRKENVLRIGQVDHHKNEVKGDRTLRAEDKRTAKVRSVSLAAIPNLCEAEAPKNELSAGLLRLWHTTARFHCVTSTGGLLTDLAFE